MAARMFEIWTEGYAVTGQSSGAMKHGEFPGETFQEAIAAYKASLPPEEATYINSDNTTYWTCRFFDNETDARKSFG